MNASSDPRRRALEKGLVCEDQRDLSPEFAQSVEGLTGGINDPVERLRFLRNSTKAVRQLEEQIPRVPRLARPLVYRYLGWRGLTLLRGDRAAGIRRGARGKIAALQVAIVLAGGGLLLGASYGTIRLAQSLGRMVPVASVPAEPEPVKPDPRVLAVAEPEVQTERVNSIWRVERTRDHELYSNGLRIDTTQRVDGTRRAFAPLDEATGRVLPVVSEPVGILFHTTESDILSLEPANNASLLRNSKNLVAYIKRHEFYHYLIDRFGRVYQILTDESRANHAGHSVWASGGKVYMNLNHAFFGVSFESRFAPEGPLPLTEAQLQAGRLLTEHLMRRYDLDPRLCVAHGIVSVNPKTRKIGHHVDWAKNFPFKTFGLPNAYDVEPASVRLFGFGYDGDLEKAIGEPWPGVFKAEAELERDALKSGQSTGELRLSRTRRFDLWFEEQSQAAKGTPSSLITPPCARRTWSQLNLMDDRKDHLWKVQEGSEAAAGDEAARGMPLGVDVGTSKIVAARRRTKGTETSMQLNAFIPVPFSRFTETILGQNEIPYFRDGDELIIFGGATERFANMFNVETRRPMADGLLNPKERMGTVVLESIMRGLIPKAKTQGEVLSFSVPAASDGREAELVYHEASLRRYFETLGYRAVAINEGLAVIFSELEDQNFTGIGISCGGGMCNVALAYLSIPSLLFGISKGGDYIDNSVGSVVNEPSTRIKTIKEEKLDLTRPPADKLEKALHIYYEDLVESLVDAIRKAVAKADKLPRAHRPLPIVIAGGTAKPKGFKELFERSMKSRPFPVDISDIRVAADPVTATARGALIAALYEK